MTGRNCNCCASVCSNFTIIIKGDGSLDGNSYFINSITSGKLLGRYSATTGNAQEITIGTGLSLNTSTGVLTATGGTSGPTGFEQHFLLMGA